ncbi:MAG: hypothetical protein KDK36_03720 [Leptospiraceae bacterium]|nr:hypothetical protein [Leptospiraceae bacterium]
MKFFLSILLIASFYFNCSSNDSKRELKSGEGSTPISGEVAGVDDRDLTEKEIYNEQISCRPHDCVTVEYEDYAELDQKINDLMAKNAGKILIKMKHYSHGVNSEEMDGVRNYLREISKRDGRVSLEPMYMGYRIVEKLTPGIIKDTAFVGWDVYNRIRNSIRYKETENYNAKVMYHPKAHTVMMIFFLHRSYGDVCRTVYSDCMELEYLDDETFDIALSNALKKAKEENRTVRVNFRQEEAKLFEFKLDMENLEKLNKSSRLYKWLILAEKTEKKQVKKERFMGLNIAVTVLDYSLKLYDFLKQYKMYSPVMDAKAEVAYSGKEEGGKIESVTFSPIPKTEKKEVE